MRLLHSHGIIMIRVYDLNPINFYGEQIEFSWNYRMTETKQQLASQLKLLLVLSRKDTRTLLNGQRSQAKNFR